MKIKIISVGIAGILLIIAVGLPQTALADEVVEMEMEFAGTLAISILHEEPITANILRSALIHLQAKGSPGRAEIRGFGGSATVDPVPVTTCLGSAGFFIRITIVDSPSVFTFKDLSLLFANGSGTGCFDLLTGLTEFETNIMFMGGRGRFEGATGQAVIVTESELVSSGLNLSGQTGTIIGTIFLP